MMDRMPDCGILLRVLQKMNVWSQEELAQAFNCSQQSISRICSAKKTSKKWPHSIETIRLKKRMTEALRQAYPEDPDGAIRMLTEHLRAYDVSRKRLKIIAEKVQLEGRSVKAARFVDEVVQLAEKSYGMATIDIEPDTADILSRISITKNQVADLMDCLVNQGMSGRMGRNMLMKMANQKNTNPLAAFELGEMYYYGYITEHATKAERNRKARYYYELAAEKGVPAASWTLGYMILKGDIPETGPRISPDDDRRMPDYQKVVYYLDQAGDQCAPALTTRGQLWQEGHYPAADFASTGRCEPVDEEKALELYRKAAGMGYYFAVNRIARYYHGRGEYVEALRQWERSARLVPHFYALNYIGQYYENGTGCERDLKKACDYYLASVEKTLPEERGPWAKINAGRVWTGRLGDYDTGKRDLRHAADLLMSALPDLALVDRFRPLYVLLEALSGREADEKEARSIGRDIVSEVRTYLNDTERQLGRENDEKTRDRLLEGQRVIADMWQTLVRRYQLESAIVLKY